VKKLIFAVLALVVALVIAALIFLPGYLEDTTNVVAEHAPYDISDDSAALHEKLVIADLHSDTLLWARDPLLRADRGHVDVPRLEEGNVALQVFSVVTKVPRGLNYDENTADSDQITLLAIAQRWPPRTWNSLLERAVYQAERLHEAAAAKPDALKVIETKAQLEELLKARAEGGNIVGGLLATEGLHPLEGDVDNIKVLYNIGYRMMGLHHFFDNDLGGSLHGLSGAGLTDFGKEVVKELEAQGIMIDVAHSSPAVVEDVLAMTQSPIFVSHTGVKGACNTARNLEDDLMKRIAATGGVIGIGYWDGAVCDIDPKSVVKSLRYAVDLLGADHVGLGSDYDGGTTVMFDTAEIAVLTEEMRAAGFKDAEIRKIMGGNIIRLFKERLPAG